MIESYSLVGPAKIRTLVVPIGKWTRKSFLEKVKLFQERFDIRLVDITPFDDATFNPQGFPQGRLMFDFRTSHVEEEHMLFLHDFEPYRKTFVIIGLVNQKLDGNVLETLRQTYPDAISHNLIYIDADSTPSKYTFNYSSASIETIICDIGRNFLEALSHYYSSYKHVTLRSPGAIGGNSVLKTTLTRQPASVTTTTATRKISGLDPTVSSGVVRSPSLKSLGRTTIPPEQQRSKARQIKILGNFQLLAGRYMDALQSFAEAASILHKHHDYIWLGNALEGLSISIVLLAYLQVPFQIPAIATHLCQLKATSQSGYSASPSKRDSISTTPMQSPRNSMSSIASKVRILDVQDVIISNVVKSISERILYYYELSLTHNSEYTPQLVYCEHILRMLQFMISCYKGQSFDQQVLRNIVLNTPFEEIKSPNNFVETESFSKLEIYRFANKLFELQLKEMDIVSQIKVYTALASVYDSLGFQRKRCFILRILFVSLMPHLDNVDINAKWKENYGEMIHALLEVYGIRRTPENSVQDASNCSWVTLQKSVLMLCVTMASKDRDKERTAEFSLLLLKRYSHVLTQTEEHRLLNDYILPSISSLPDLQYWDPFLVRNLEILQLDVNREMPRKKQIAPININGFNENSSDSAVFNPFRQNSVNGVTELSQGGHRNVTFLLGETAELIVTLQNPFKFNIEITELSFVPEDELYVKFLKDLSFNELPLLIPGNSMRSIHLPVAFINETAEEGQSIDKLRIGVFGLPPQLMRIVVSENLLHSREESNNDDGNERCNYGCFRYQVIPEGPELEFVSSTLNDNACMLLDGTKKMFSFIVRNKSLDQSANYLVFSHLTSVEKSLKPDYWKKMPQDDLYEIETQLKWLQHSCVRFLNAPHAIEANSTAEINVELNMARVPFQFSGFDILIEYGMQNSTNSNVIYTKVLHVPIEITLKRSVEIPNMNVIPLTESFNEVENVMDCVPYLMNKVKKNGEQISDYALMLLDMRNSWLHDVSLNVQYDDFIGNSISIESMHTVRVVIPIRRFSATLNLKAKEIPHLVTGRQFVSSGLTEEQTSDMREKFWCRERILEGISCEWKLQDTVGTTGTVDFRQFLEKIDTRLLDILSPHRGSSYAVDLSSHKNMIEVGEILQIKATVKFNTLHAKNDETVSLSFLLFNRRTGKTIPKASNAVLYNGKLTRQIRPMHNSEVTLDLLPLERGEYEIACCLNSSEFNDVPVYFRVM
ncbi:LAFE_0F15522g1_1 [Lachancea fermentati]|uniref:LAFE_0F15522g1_1 n=1 Tax=Lachancea fermentati TaxID=4955 RepID=A0A1G4MG17_LACFM|nr:LAFE_0F15522g1_1 [Lachancea fermentati]